MPVRRAPPWNPAPLLVASALLTACASGPQRASREEPRLDTETAHRLRHAALLGKGASALASGATRAACGEEGEVDGCGERITRAMLLSPRTGVPLSSLAWSHT